MKLRIRDDSLRLRLTVSEVDRIGSGQAVTGRTRFPGGSTLIYTLRPDAGCEEMTASFDPPAGVIEVCIPAADGRTWQADSAQVGLNARLRLADEATLALLIEKDFACLDPGVQEDQSDTFERPGTLQ